MQNQHKLTMYGIKNCDTIKKAQKYLKEQQVDFQFHDYRKDGINESLLDQFIQAMGWQPLLNQRGTTWRQLTPEVKASITDVNSAKALMLTSPAIIKRPLLFNGKDYLLGFNTESYQKFINQ